MADSENDDNSDELTQEVIERKPLGGIPFFCSLLFLIVLSAFNLVILPVIFEAHSWWRWLAFLCGVAIGAVCARYFFQGSLAVFLHELKHSVLSNLAGNKAKRMVVKEESGFFEYSYSKHTAHMNAMISLAPYFLPVLTPCFFLFGLAVSYAYAFPVLVLTGFGYGADQVLHLRDLAPHQTDLSDIRGGYKVGLAYVIAMNLAIFTFIAAWVTDGSDGVAFLFFGLVKLGERLFGPLLLPGR